MNRTEKQREVETLSQTIGSAGSAFLIDFERLDVARCTDLRVRLRKHEGRLRIVKNRLAKRALSDSSLAQLEPALRGQTAVAWSLGDDVIGVARVLRDFAKEHDLGKVKAGVVEGRFIGAEEFQSIADLPSREQLLAKALYLMQYPVTGLVTALSGVLRNFVVVVDQIRQQKESQQGA